MAILRTTKTLSIDIETFSRVDLSKAGVYAYAEDPSFEVLLFAYAFDDKPVQVVDLASGEVLPDEVRTALQDPNITKAAWNANFERVCLWKMTGWPMPPEEWSDTMIMAAELGLPKSLAEAGRVLGLSEDKQKLQEGKNLIQYFSKPARPSKANGMRDRNTPEHAPEKWALYKEYNARDVETEREIRRRLSVYDIAESEQRLWCIDQDINDRGVMFDRLFVENAAELDARVRRRLKEEARQISGLETPNSVGQIKKWIKERTGVEVESLDNRVIGDVLEQIKDDPVCARFLQIRGSLSKTSTAKYTRALQCANTDDRIRGLSQFYGASRTGRWAGRNLQLQNLKRNDMPDADLDLARELVKTGDFETLALFYDEMSTLSELIRTSFIPRPGCKFVVSDFSAIEARVLAWLAGENWRLEAFERGEDIYCASASRMFGVPVEKHGTNGHLRQKGKIAELALGYGGSVGALKAMGALEMGLQENELQPLVDSWRSANRKITKLWWDVDKAARGCIIYGSPKRLGRIRMRMDEDLLRIGLPSGREISYFQPKVTGSGDITYKGQIQAGGWGKIETYGPKLVENIIQAISRDCLAESMKRLAGEGILVVFHVHDEVICEVPEDKTTFYANNAPYFTITHGQAEVIAHIMGEPISWAPGLPMKADAYECEYYRKD